MAKMNNFGGEVNEHQLLLMSNANKDVFPGNEPNNYRIRLQQPLDLHGNWQVGLRAIHFPLEFGPKAAADTAATVAATTVAVASDAATATTTTAQVPSKKPEDTTPRPGSGLPFDFSIPADHTFLPRRKIRRHEGFARDAASLSNPDPSLLSYSEQFDFAVAYLEGKALVQYSSSELRKKIDKGNTYVLNIVEKMLLDDFQARRRAEGDAKGFYTVEKKLEYAVRMLRVHGVADEYIRPNTLREGIVESAGNVDSVINSVIDLDRLFRGLQGPTVSYVLAKHAMMHVDWWELTLKKVEFELSARGELAKPELQERIKKENVRKRAIADAMKVILRTLKRAGVYYVDFAELEEQLSSLTEHTTASNTRIVKFWKARRKRDQEDRDEVEDFIHATLWLDAMQIDHTLRPMHTLNILKHLELDMDIESAVWSVFYGKSSPSPGERDVKAGEILSRRQIKFPTKVKIRYAIDKCLMLRDEIERAKQSADFSEGLIGGEGEGDEGRQGITGLKLELDRTIETLARNYYASLGWRHVSKELLEGLIQTHRPAKLSNDQIQSRIELGHLQRRAYNDHLAYTRSDTVCKDRDTVIPKYLYVFSDLAAVRLIGDQDGSYLALVRVPTEKIALGQTTDDFFPPEIVYHPVAKNHVTMIEVDIRDEKGCDVSFAVGPVIVDVHLKRVS